MTAPALVIFAAGPHDAKVGRVIGEIAATTRRARPDLSTAVAFAAGDKSDLTSVVTRLSSQGHQEFVVVPLLVAPTEAEDLDLARALESAARANPEAYMRGAEAIGADPGLLTVLDQRLRTALRAARVRELDAMVLASNGCRDASVNVALSRLARLWTARHHLPTSLAFAETCAPTTGEAVREWRRRGKRHVAVGSLFLTPGLPAERAADLALEAGACAVSAPLGAHEELSRLIVARYAVSALELVPV